VAVEQEEDYKETWPMTYTPQLHMQLCQCATQGIERPWHWFLAFAMQGEEVRLMEKGINRQLWRGELSLCLLFNHHQVPCP
jgi:hypothetical protein